MFKWILLKTYSLMQDLKDWSKAPEIESKQYQCYVNKLSDIQIDTHTQYPWTNSMKENLS